MNIPCYLLDIHCSRNRWSEVGLRPGVNGTHDLGPKLSEGARRERSALGAGQQRNGFRPISLCQNLMTRLNVNQK